MSAVTAILSQIEQGDPQAAEKLLPLVYGERRNLAAQKIAMRRVTRHEWPSAHLPPAFLTPRR